MKNNLNHLDQKGKVIIPVVLILGIFIGSVIVLKSQGIGATVLKEGKKFFVPVASDPEADPDNDGLKNWEEEMYKTDKRNPDTDGDGYLDGEEIVSGYDPTIPAPNDALEGTDTSTPRPNPTNLTDYLTQLITEKVSSGEIKPVDDLNLAPDSTLLNNEAIFNEALLQVTKKANEDFDISKIEIANINISEKETTKEEISRYISEMSKVLNNDAVYAEIGMSEAEIISEAVELKEFKNLDKIIEFYDQGVKSIQNITVPKDFVDLHKKQISILKLTNKILKSIRDFEKDPATAAAAIEKYQDLPRIINEFTNELIERIGKYSN